MHIGENIFSCLFWDANSNETQNQCLYLYGYPWRIRREQSWPDSWGCLNSYKFFKLLNDVAFGVVTGKAIGSAFKIMANTGTPVLIMGWDNNIGLG